MDCAYTFNYTSSKVKLANKGHILFTCLAIVIDYSLLCQQVYNVPYAVLLLHIQTTTGTFISL